jgi:hypothetical protein
MTAAAPAPADTWIRRHRLIFYFALAYAISWPLFLLSRLTGGTFGTVLLVVGGFGPPLAAAITPGRLMSMRFSNDDDLR